MLVQRPRSKVALWHIPLCKLVPAAGGPGLETKDRDEAAKPTASTSASAKDMVKDALMDTLKGDNMTVKSVLGDSTFAALEKAVGQEQVAKVTGVLDPILKNRRLVTLVSAFVDVALILAGIKFFQNVTSGEGN